MVMLLSSMASVIFVIIMIIIVVITIFISNKKMKKINERSKERERDFLAANAVFLLGQTDKADASTPAVKKPLKELSGDEKMVVLDGGTLNPGDLSWDGFKIFGSITVYDVTKPEQTLERIQDASIVFTNKTVISREMIEACPNMKYIGVLATGYNVVDINAAAEHGIAVTNVPGYGTDAVAQFTFALMLEMCNQVGKHSESVMNGGWCRQENFSYWLAPLSDISKKTLGIIGYGSIGQKVAEIAVAFGMRVIVYSRTKKSSTVKIKWVEFEELLAESDIITLHCPLTYENKELINEAAINKMKDGAKLINTARGGLINEKALAEALNSGKLSGAALDVITVEPMRSDSVLFGVQNLIITPHIAWASHEARTRLMDIAVGNVRAFLEGNPENIVS